MPRTHILFLFVLQTVSIKAKPLINQPPSFLSFINSSSYYPSVTMPDYLHSAARSQSRADVHLHGCVATNALLVYIDLLRVQRPLAPCISTTCTLSCPNELLQSEGGETRGDCINVKLGQGLVCGAPPLLFACKLFERCHCSRTTFLFGKTASTQQNQQGLACPENSYIATFHLKT